MRINTFELWRDNGKTEHFIKAYDREGNLVVDETFKDREKAKDLYYKLHYDDSIFYLEHKELISSSRGINASPEEVERELAKL